MNKAILQIWEESSIDNNILEISKKENFFSSLKIEFDEYEKNKIKKSRYEIDIEL